MLAGLLGNWSRRNVHRIVGSLRAADPAEIFRPSDVGGSRFFLVAGALNWFGDPLREAMERNFAAVLGGFAALVVAGFVIAVKVF